MLVRAMEFEPSFNQFSVCVALVMRDDDGSGGTGIVI
jgi:hypothetical protein